MTFSWAALAMGGAARRDGCREQQLYLKQPLPAASGLSVVAELCQTGILGALLQAEAHRESCTSAGNAVPDCKCEGSPTFPSPTSSIPLIPQESNHSIKCFLITF